MRRELIGLSKLLSLALRHDPSALALEVDAAGWTQVDALVEAVRVRHPGFSRAVLEELVATNEKRRFVLSGDGLRIRAAQGHSIGIDLGLPPAVPPVLLFHGTASRSLASIREQGLRPGGRDYVHLSADADAAAHVGSRHGRPVVLVVEARRMAEAGHTFHVAQNGVWLVRDVPVRFLRLPPA